eukprot:s1190_g8.t1
MLGAGLAAGGADLAGNGGANTGVDSSEGGDEDDDGGGAALALARPLVLLDLAAPLGAMSKGRTGPLSQLALDIGGRRPANDMRFITDDAHRPGAVGLLGLHWASGAALGCRTVLL